MRRASVVAVLAFLVLPAFAQFSERLEVRVHEIDVVVETRDGKPVMSLGKDDFIVLEDGAAQQITNFSIVNESAGSATAAVKPAVAQTTQPTESARKPRKFIFFLDAFEMLEETRQGLMRQAEQLVGVMRDGDEAMVVTPAWPNRIPLFFTPDKKALMASLDHVTRVMARAGDVKAGSLMADNRAETMIQIQSGLGGRGNSADPSLHPAPTREEQTLRRGDCGASFRKCAEMRLGDLKSIVSAVGELPGKKVVVVMSSHMTSTPGLELGNPHISNPREIVSSYRDLRRETNEIAKIAASNNVSIYGIETYEPGTSLLYGSSVEEGRDVSHDIPHPRAPGIEGAQDLLGTLAESTGAKAFAGLHESDEMFSQISQDLTSYYSIGYRATDSKKKDHSVDVRVRNHPEYVVRARRSVHTQTPDEEQRGLAMAAVLSANHSNQLGITLTASPLVRKMRRVEIPVHVHVPLSRLTFIDDGDTRRAQFKVVVAAVGEHADFGTSQLEHAQDIRVPASRWDDAQKQHFTYDTTVVVTPGRYRIAVGATDMTSGESGFQTFDVNAQ